MLSPTAVVADSRASERIRSMAARTLSGQPVGERDQQLLCEFQRRCVIRDQRVRCLDLRDLGFRSHDVTRLADALELNTTLTHLDLGSKDAGLSNWTYEAKLRQRGVNKIGDEGAGRLGASLAVSVGLTKLSLESNEICAPGATGLAAALQVNTTLTWLQSGFNLFGSEGACALAAALKPSGLRWLNVGVSKPAYKYGVNADGSTAAKQTSHELDHAALASALLTKDEFTQAEWDEFAVEAMTGDSFIQAGPPPGAFFTPAEPGNMTLRHLDLCDNEIGDAGVAAIASALITHPALTTLVVRANEVGDAGATALAAGLRSNGALRELDLGDNNVSGRGAVELLCALAGNDILVDLNLGTNRLADTIHAGRVETALAGNCALKQLDLGANALGPHAATMFAEVLRTNSTLEALDLGANKIGSVGAEKLAQAVQVNNSLRTLMVDDNAIGSSDDPALGAWRALGCALAANTALRWLSVGMNRIGDSGAAHLMDAMAQNSTLASLDIAHGHIGSHGATAVAEALQCNSALTQLDLHHNDWDNSCAVRLGLRV